MDREADLMIQQRVDKCTVKMCQTNSDIFLQKKKKHTSINGDFYGSDSIQLLSWFIKALECHGPALLSPMQQLKSHEGIVTKVIKGN